MSLRLEMMLTVVSYGRNNIIFYEKKLKLTKYNNRLIFSEKIFSTIFIVKYQWLKSLKDF